MGWYHARCIFNTFTRSRKNTRIIQSAEDLEGFAHIEHPDQELVRGYIRGGENLRRRGGLHVGGRIETPKRGAPVDPDDTREAKKTKKLLAEMPLKKGDRVWTHCRVRPSDVGPPDAAGMVEVVVKSKKPELGMIRSEIQDGCLIIQFESAEDEKERLEKFADRKYRRTRAWLRYPRAFEGKKQKIPVNWIVSNRTPPRLCSCLKQDWGHNCECEVGEGAITCGRGTQKAIFGVCQ